MNYKAYTFLACCLLNSGAYSHEEKVADLQEISVAPERSEADAPCGVSFEEHFKSLPESERKEWELFARAMEEEQKKILDAVSKFFEGRSLMLKRYYEACRQPFNFELNFQLSDQFIDKMNALEAGMEDSSAQEASA